MDEKNKFYPFYPSIRKLMQKSNEIQLCVKSYKNNKYHMIFKTNSYYPTLIF